MLLMRLSALAAAALSSGGCASAPASQVALWPADVTASLAVERVDASDWSVQARTGGILFAQTTPVELKVLQTALANVSSIHVSWTPPNPPSSSAFDVVFGAASPEVIPSPHSVGLHVQVALTASDIAQAEHVIRELLTTTPASVRQLIPDLPTDGARTASTLARSLCASTGFTSHVTSGSEACFSASFQLAVEHNLPRIDEWLSVRVLTHDLRLRVATLSLRPSDQLLDLSGEVLVSGVISSGKLSSQMLDHPTDQVFAATKIDLTAGRIPMESILDFENTAGHFLDAFTPLRGDIRLSVLGEGFHRRFRVEVAGLSDRESSACKGGNSSMKVLLLVPISTSVYADLDELRRMERFGELTLHSPTKHIEIERPTAVSSQHQIALEFALDPTISSHSFEFPIHLRYQSPSNSTFYAPAILNPPDIFATCSSESIHSDRGSPNLLFSRWLSDSAWGAVGWHRVIPQLPLEPVSVPVPVGFTPHGSVVSAITLSVTGLGALLLVYIAIGATRHSSNEQASAWKPKSQ